MKNDAWYQNVLNEVDKRVLAAATLLQAEHKRDLSRMNPPPHLNSSKPGEFPKARTLNLRNAVTLKKISVAHYRVGYLTNASYIVFLSRRLRKTIKDTAERIKAKLEAIIRG
jgi:hypothetical protein